jgi:hypothetical protein
MTTEKLEMLKRGYRYVGWNEFIEKGNRHDKN